MTLTFSDSDNKLWNQIFISLDGEGCKLDESDTDSDSEPELTQVKDSDEENETKPESEVTPELAIQICWTQVLRDQLKNSSIQLVDLVKSVLQQMDEVGINLPIFWDAI